MKIRPLEAELSLQTNGLTDMMKLKVTLRNFTNAHNETDSYVIQVLAEI